MAIKKHFNWIKHFFHMAYHHTERFLLVVLVVLLVADVLLGILARFIHFEVVFATELGKYIFIWLCAIGISAAAKDNQHVRMNFIVEKLGIDRKISWILSQVLFLIFCLFFFIYGLRLTWMHIQMDKSAMGFVFPMFIFTSALPIGFALTTVRIIADILKSLKSPEYTPWIAEMNSAISETSNENNNLTI